MKVLILDNYDSFTYNLFHYFKGYTPEVTVKRNDEITGEALEEYSHIVISPGPGLPQNAGILMDVLDRYSTSKPILGICLGLQAIVEHFGGELYNQKIVKHGLQEEIDVLNNASGLFKGFDNSIHVGLYHSWAAKKENLPQELEITAKGKTGVIMAIEHKTLPISAVQFHPESILTPSGKQIIKNWIEAN
jgi:anthranilate synthase component 2